MPALDFNVFHRDELPARLATDDGLRAARDVRGVGALAFRLPDGRAYTYTAAGDCIAIDAGDATAETVVALDEADWRRFVDELATAAGLVHGGRARFPRGGYAHLERWEPALRMLFVGRPIYDPTALKVPDRLDRSFALDDPGLATFLRATGFALVKRVFATDEVSRLRAAAERLADDAVPGDRRSWWTRTADGADVLSRITYAGVRAPVIGALDDDARLRRLAALAGDDLRPAGDRCDGHSLVIKHGGVAEGLGDLPWHRDCGLGGHPVMCPSLQIGIQLDAATADSGRLLFLAGSAGVSCHRSALDRGPIVAVDTEPGDCTVHFGDVLHAAPPPARPGRGRRALYVSFFPARTFAAIPAGRGYNDLLLSRDDGLVAADAPA
ncbi:MAG TPA: phytanoyl-CoA dioxygenase family protein [Candidatus Binatia bacterium]|nr:phytanoyl-CoA dioxygenase family protein [Candidatus Binatia bacterium]